MAKEIELTRGKVAIVDDEDYEMLSRYSWNYMTVGYAAGDIQGKPVYMHRIIMDAPKKVMVDHRNGDKLDNRRSNLRLCNQQQNQGNRRSITGTSQYKGVIWSKGKKKWRAEIRPGGRCVFLGYYDIEADAARRYDSAARTVYGEFALTNFPGDERLDQKELEPKQIHTSSYRGVGLDKKNNKWRVQISKGDKNNFIGYFPDEISAAKAYDDAALRFHGKLAKLNFPQVEEISYE